MDWRDNWIEDHKGDRPFAAGALAYVLGWTRGYGCHFGMRSTAQWARSEYAKGWDAAQRDWPQD